MAKTPIPPLPWLGLEEDPNWVPLYQAPFVYRIRTGENWCEPWDSIALSRELATRLRHLGVREAMINPETGEVTLILSEDAHDSVSETVHFHLTEYNLDATVGEQLREEIAEWVAPMRVRVENWLRRAVEQRCCVIVARPISMLADYRRISHSVFPRFRFTNLREGEAVNAAGEMLHFLRVAPLHCNAPTRGTHNRKPPPPGSVSEQICNYVQRTYPAGKPSRRFSYIALKKELEGAGVHASEATVRQAVQEYLGWPKREKKA